MNTWENIRAMWVNGEQKDVRLALNQMNKIDILTMIREALTNDRRFRSADGTHCGDLTDLWEVLTFYC